MTNGISCDAMFSIVFRGDLEVDWSEPGPLFWILFRAVWWLWIFWEIVLRWA
jgi:hypothetical protein